MAGVPTSSAEHCDVRSEVLTQDARDDLREQARRKALQTMTEVEWETAREASGNPVKADAVMAAGLGILEPDK